MLTKDQEMIIDEYVPDEYFDRDKLKRYLSIHEQVGVEVFDYVVRKDEKAEKRLLSDWPLIFDGKFDWRYDDPIELRQYTWYEPENVETFVRRIPFNFHVYEVVRNDEKNAYMSIDELFFAVGFQVEDFYNHDRRSITMEEMYNYLEFLYYDCGIGLDEIFDYCGGQIDVANTSIYCDWFSYLDMCKKLGWDDVMPTKFYYKYNLAREALGLEPIIFYIQELDYEAWSRDRSQVQFYKRCGNKITFRGEFPCDEDNNPVLRWIGIELKSVESIKCSKIDGLEVYMEVTVGPNSIIKALLYERDELGNEQFDHEPKWALMYAGPQTMTFNYKYLKKRRKELGYTQKQVADAVQANIRTYQKWETGETNPDGYYLLRIMNWLDIPSVTDVIQYDQDQDIMTISDFV